MLISRRLVMIGALASAAIVPTDASAFLFELSGIKPALPEDEHLAEMIVAGLPTDNFRTVMGALADLKTRGSTGELFNRRWATYANPLLVRIWRDMGHDEEHTDCDKWCGVTLGWCLKRAGIQPPPNCASSQSYLDAHWGSPVDHPKLGDICVFTHSKNPGYGHVAICEASPSKSAVRVLGANQQFSGLTNCPGGRTVNIIDRRDMSLNGELHLNKYIRPPAR